MRVGEEAFLCLRLGRFVNLMSMSRLSVVFSEN